MVADRLSGCRLRVAAFRRVVGSGPLRAGLAVSAAGVAVAAAAVPGETVARARAEARALLQRIRPALLGLPVGEGRLSGAGRLAFSRSTLSTKSATSLLKERINYGWST